MPDSMRGQTPGTLTVEVDMKTWIECQPKTKNAKENTQRQQSNKRETGKKKKQAQNRQKLNKSV